MSAECVPSSGNTSRVSRRGSRDKTQNDDWYSTYPLARGLTVFLDRDTMEFRRAKSSPKLHARDALLVQLYPLLSIVKF